MSPRDPTPNKVLTSTIQAVLLSLLSSFLAQSIAFYQFHDPFTLITAARFALFTALSTPPNLFWQSLLEDAFPSYTTEPKVVRYKRSTRAEDFTDLKEPSGLETEQGEEERKAANEELKRWESTKDEWTDVVETKRRLSWKNTAIKFSLDQTIGALVNTILFVAGMAGLRGESRDAALGRVRNDIWPIMRAGYKFWPLVSISMFTFVPADKRVVVGSAVGVIWGVFLALFVK